MSKYTKVIPSDISEAIGWLLPFIEPRKKFLDVGCSTGYFGGYIKNSKKLQVDGIEISEDKEVAKNVLDNVYSFDLDAPWPPSFTKNRYDYILFGDVLEHLKDPLNSLIQAKKLLLPGGKIFVSIPNIAHISIRLELLLGDFEYEETGILDNTHLKYFTKRSFEALVKKAGLGVIEANSSLNDYPDEVIAAMLKKIGLTATKDFLEYANSPEARAFQYKFVLGAKKATKSGGNIIKQAQKPEHFRDEYISDLRSQIKNIKDHADEQARIISAQAHQIDVLTGQRSILSRVIARLKK